MTLQYHYIVPGDDFVHAGEASGHLKGVLRQLGYPGDAIRRVAVPELDFVQVAVQRENRKRDNVRTDIAEVDVGVARRM